MLLRERQRLGVASPPDKSQPYVAFLITVALWVIPGIVALVYGESEPGVQVIIEDIA